MKFSGSNGTFDVKVNGTTVGTVPYSTSATTTTISNINVSGNVTVSLVNNSSTNRVAIDDLSWTCYSESSARQAQSISPEATKSFKISPNPVTNQEIFVKGDLQSVKKLKSIHFRVRFYKQLISHSEMVTLLKPEIWVREFIF